MQNFFYELWDGDLSWSAWIFAVAALLFTAWMFIAALRNGDYLWAAFIFFFSGFSALLYFFMVYRSSGGMGNPMAGFELPGAADRRQIKKLEADIHHLDKPHMHLQLADIYFSQGKLEQAEESYRAAYARDPNDDDIRAHLGNCLVRREKAAEALPLLESVCAQNPKHDYGYTLMTLAETQSACGKIEESLTTWRQVLKMYGYPRARVQFADLLIQRKEYPEARQSLEEVIHDAPYATAFQRKREAVWFKRAKALLRSIPN